MKTIAFVTDTWSEKDVNGVVRWLRVMSRELTTRGYRVIIIHPGMFPHFSWPTDPDNVKFSFCTRTKLRDIISHEKPDHIHIVTESTLGFSALRLCQRHGWTFSTFYHTRSPEYLRKRFYIPEVLPYVYLRWFHNQSSWTAVGTPSIAHILENKGFRNLVTIPLGIDQELFTRNDHVDIATTVAAGLTKPIFTYLGRLAPEKNLEAFLDCDLPGSKLVIGSGPSRKSLGKKYGNGKTGQAIQFVGHKHSREIVDLLSVSDVLVFPSHTDTFGMTIVEALACGVPVAAYDVPGPRDIITSGKDGYLSDDLRASALKCLDLKSEDCIAKAREYSWAKAAELFIEHLSKTILPDHE